MDKIKILSPTAILGYGFPIESFRKGLDKKPDLIAVDAGSTDPGPYYLGAGESFTDEKSVYRDLEIILKARNKLDIPVIIGSAGGAGGDPHLNWNKQIIKEIAEQENLSFTLATIHAEFDKQFLSNEFKKGNISPLKPAEPINEQEIKKSKRIVGQMGNEPIIQALEKGAEVILAGRAYDPAVFAGFCIHHNFPAGLALHMGKIMECASIAAEPGSGSDCIFGTLKKNSFILEPLNPERKCTSTSIAAHTLYEKSNPEMLPGPGGKIDLRETTFSQLNDRKVKVSGSKFIRDTNYTIKLEGVKKVGYRTISIAGIRDPIMIKQIDNIIDKIKQATKTNFTDISENAYELLFRVYGKNGVMGKIEPQSEISSHELGLIIEVIGKTQKLANTICSFARSTILHYGYENRIATAGNLAFPFSPSDLKAGSVYEFNILQLLKTENPTSLFPIKMQDIQN